MRNAIKLLIVLSLLAWPVAAIAGWPVLPPTVTADQIISPDGTIDADKMVTVALLNPGEYSAKCQAFTASAAIWTGTLFVESATATPATPFLYLWNGAATYYSIRCGATLANTMYQRCTITSPVNLTAANWRFCVGNDLNDAAQVNIGVQTFYVWGAQVEAQSFATSYCGPTLNAAKTCNADVVSMPNPLRGVGSDWTNGILYSEQFDNATWIAADIVVTPNAGLAPDGSMSADRADIVPVPTCASRIVPAGAGLAVVQNTTYTASVWLWALVGNPQVRIGRNNGISWIGGSDSPTLTLTATPTRYSLTYTTLPGENRSNISVGGECTTPFIPTASGSFYIWGEQHEQASTPSNYCGPTLAAALTCGPGGAIGKVRTNVALWSQQLDHVAGGVWVRDGLSTVTADAVVGPTGVAVGAGDLLVESGAAGVAHRLYQSYTSTATAWTVSVYAKPKERSWFAIVVDGASGAGAFFDASNCTVGTVSPGVTAAVASVDANGWCRASATRTTGAGANHGDIYLASADNTAVYNGDGTSGMYFTGAQVELGAEATPYCGETLATTKRCAPHQEYCVRVKNVQADVWSAARQLFSMGTYLSNNSSYLYNNLVGAVYPTVRDGYGDWSQGSWFSGYAAGSAHVVEYCSNDGILSMYSDGTPVVLTDISTCTYCMFTTMPSAVYPGMISTSVANLNGLVEGYDLCLKGTPQLCGWR